MIYTTVLFLVPFLALLLYFLFRNFLNKQFSLILNFSGAFLFFITFLHLIPEVFENFRITTGLFILFGFFTQVFLDYSSKGIEHGHSFESNKKGTLKKFPLILLSLYLHSFLEMSAIVINLTDNRYTELLFFLGIITHKLPISIVLLAILRNFQVTKKYVFLSIFIFALTAPLGIIFSSYVKVNYFNLLEFLQPFSIGIILHVSTTIIFEGNNKNHNFTMKNVITYIFAFLLVSFSLFFD